MIWHSARFARADLFLVDSIVLHPSQERGDLVLVDYAIRTTLGMLFKDRGNESLRHPTILVEPIPGR